MLNGDAHLPMRVRIELRIRPVALFSKTRTAKEYHNLIDRIQRMGRQATSREEYQAKVSNDNGITRAKVPAPLLRDMKAKPGSYLTFRLNGNEVVMRVKKKK
jgi:hypothetical protein